MLIKDEPADNIQPFDTLDHSKNGDPFAGKTFHYMMANPPFGVEWKPQQNFIEKEYEEFGFDGRFGPGLPRINDGALLFLLHMISKRKPSPPRSPSPSMGRPCSRGMPDRVTRRFDRLELQRAM